MKQFFTLLLNTLSRLVAIFLSILIIFILAKPFFILFNFDAYGGISPLLPFKAMWHGLRMDISISSYLTAIPLILLIIGIWEKKGKNSTRGLSVAWNIYRWFLSVLQAVILTLDTVLYSFWGFKLDTTPLFYFFSSPSSALASVSFEYILIGVLFIGLLTWGLSSWYRIAWNHAFFTPVKKKDAVWQSILLTFTLVVCGGLLFLGIRGGVTVSTMNLSTAYFSDEPRENHAAVNPMFSLMSSMGKEKHPEKDFQYFDKEEEAHAAMRSYEKKTTDDATAAPQPPLLRNLRPDIYVVILESFSSHLFPTLGGEKIAVGLDTLAKSGVLFTRFYANSFRTDRGLTSIISAYPAMPASSIMKYVEKTDQLPSFPKTLAKAGYDLEYYYGGDINFTNMNAYLRSAGFKKIVKDSDFPVNERLSKWGVHDDRLFSHISQRLKGTSYDSGNPKLRIIQTSSSHEPFEVPYHNSRLHDQRAVAFAYTDSCVSNFIREMWLRPTLWDNSLWIIVPDHYGAYPENPEGKDSRYRIPLILLGGALSPEYRGREIDVVGSQIDIAATLLSQLGLPTEEFIFSKNMLSDKSPHYAWFCNPDYAALVSDQDVTVLNLATGKEQGIGGSNLSSVKAYLQLLYTDFSRR